jgi:hypothetical protein
MAVTDALGSLLDAAKKIEPTAERREQQRWSFAFGDAGVREQADRNVIAREFTDAHVVACGACRLPIKPDRKWLTNFGAPQRDS